MKNDFLREYLRDNKKVVIPAQNNEKTDEFTDESADKVMNIIRSMTHEIHQRLNSISRYVGIPYKVTDINEQELPAMANGRNQPREGYVGYTVDLKNYRNCFGTVRFCAGAPADGEQGIVRGMVIDDDGNIECVAPCCKKNSHGWARLPLTEKSAKLVATLPLDDNGNPLFVPEYVELLPDGIVQSLSEYMSDIVAYSLELNERLQKLEQGNIVCCGCPKD